MNFPSHKKEGISISRQQKKPQARTILLDLAYDLVGSAVYSIGVYTFARPGGFAIGGVSGLSLILNRLIGLPVGVATLLLNLPLILLSYRTLGRLFLLKTVKTILIQTLMLDLVMPRFPVYTGSQLLASLFAGVLIGTGLGLVYMRGSSTGGTDFLIHMLHKAFPHLSVGQFSLGLDAVILAAGAAVYGQIDAALYGLICTYATSQLMDGLLYGAGSGKMALVITDKGEETARLIGSEIGRGATLMQATGAYSGRPRSLLLCACSKSQIFKVRALAHRVDRQAMVMVTQVDEIWGEGFRPPEEEA